MTLSYLQQRPYLVSVAEAARLLGVKKPHPVKTLRGRRANLLLFTAAVPPHLSASAGRLSAALLVW